MSTVRPLRLCQMLPPLPLTPPPLLTHVFAQPSFAGRALEILQLPGMETALALGSADRQLGLAFKKLFQHESGVELKVKGKLNTVTAQVEVHGALNKVSYEPAARVGFCLQCTACRAQEPSWVRTVGAVECSPVWRRPARNLPSQPRSSSDWASSRHLTQTRCTSRTRACDSAWASRQQAWAARPCLRVRADHAAACRRGWLAALSQRARLLAAGSSCAAEH